MTNANHDVAVHERITSLESKVGMLTTLVFAQLALQATTLIALASLGR